MATRRQKLIAEHFTALYPLAPWADAEPIRIAASRQAMKTLAPEVALWLAGIAHIRHMHTDYDTMMDEGYGRDAARFFIIDDINDVLRLWRCPRLLVSAEELAEIEAEGADLQSMTSGDE